MSFINGFTKTALSDPDQKIKMRATPKKYGGTSGRSKYLLQHHPKEKRWSCSCPDWQYRRQSLTDKKDRDCKHIVAHKKGIKPWEAKQKLQPTQSND